MGRVQCSRRLGAPGRECNSCFNIYYVWKYDLKTIEDKSWFELKSQLVFCKDSHRSIKIQDKWQTLWAVD